MSRTTTPQQGTFGGSQTQTGNYQQSGTQQGGQGQHTQAFRERVAKRAYEKWMKRGCKDGYAIQDWIEAEAELVAEQKRPGGSTYSN
jgi:hypothetical protein